MNDRKGPLFNKKILITRNKEQAQSFLTKIRELGGEGISVPLLTFACALSEKDTVRFRSQITDADWLVFTSVNGVKYFISYTKELSKPSSWKVAAVGEKTARFLQKHGFSVDVIPEIFVAENLAASLAPHVKSHDRIAVLKGNLSRDTIKKELSPLGCEITEWVLYETRPNEEGIGLLRTAITSNRLDFITFTSSSSVHTFMQAVKDEDLSYLRETSIVSIGPVTQSALQEYGLQSVVPSKHTIEGMLAKMCELAKERE
ncbi:uroporphyrinogen-III synthase [Bacillus gobiensis]|uniref:uroporphyrinogen-III synthase n=1 Tax=Bacillus gobiensis TaxID=1441095 RepID=UPI003D1FC0F2